MALSYKSKSKSKSSYVFYIVLVGCAGLLKGIALANFGAFQDSDIYFQIYQRVNEVGAFQSAIEFSSQTLKLEPIIFFIYGIISTFKIIELNEYLFILLNMTFMSLFIGKLMYSFLPENKRINYFELTLMAFIVPLGYLFFSKDLYFWRSILALGFFIIFIKSTGLKRLIFAVLSVGSHISFIFFLLLYLITQNIAVLNKRWIYIIYAGFPIAMFLALTLFPSIIAFIASGGDSTVYIEQGGAHTTKVWLSILFSFFILLLVRDDLMRDINLRPLYLFCLTTVCVGLFSYNSYHLMNRIFLPASILVGYLPFLIYTDKLKVKIAKYLVAFTFLPSLRLIIMLVTGEFNPA